MRPSNCPSSRRRCSNCPMRRWRAYRARWSTKRLVSRSISFRVDTDLGDRRTEHWQPSRLQRKVQDPKQRKIEDLRAIPWGFSWGQCRLLLTGWYEVSAARWPAHLDSAPSDAERARRRPHCSRRWRPGRSSRTCFPTLDMQIAGEDRPRRSRRATHSSCRTKLRKHVLNERIVARGMGERTSKALSEITCKPSERLAEESAAGAFDQEPLPVSRPVEPLAGGVMLKRHRAGDTNARVRRGIHLSINGIAAGLRNTG